MIPQRRSQDLARCLFGTVAMALLYSLPVIIQHLAPRSLFEASRRQAEPFLYGSMAALTCVEAGPSTSFIYFQF